MSNLRLAVTLLLATLSLWATGCQSLDIDKALPWAGDGSKKDESPVKMVAFWADTVLYQSGRRPTRGFGGRIYFYNRKNEPVKVDGSLIVYAFDDTHRDDVESRPRRKNVFTPEQFAKYYDPTHLGPSYSIWIPWDAAGGEQREINLLPFFKPTDGDVLVGEQTRHTLPGKASSPPAPDHRRREEERRRVETASVRPVGYQEPLDRTSPKDGEHPRADTERNRMRTMVITIPNSLKARMGPPPAAYHRPGGTARTGPPPPWRPQPLGRGGTRPWAQDADAAPGRSAGPAFGGVTAKNLESASPGPGPISTDPAPADPLSTRSAHFRRRAPTAPVARRSFDHARLRPFHAASPSARERTPSTASVHGSPESWPAASGAGR